jgi:hypothetical protein
MDGDVVRGPRSRGIDVGTAAEAGMIRRCDEDHLSFATVQGGCFTPLMLETSTRSIRHG